MLGEIRSYIFFNYLKYISISISIFIGLIWVSQILRILELQHSITTQLFDVVNTTILVLPSFISPLMPFLLIITGFFLNYKFISSNEILILKQYLSMKNNLIVTIFLASGIMLFYFLNNEYFSTKLYHKYKIKELEIRNNLKLGVSSLKEFHIEEEVSIFFNKQKNNKFYNVEAVIYEDGQFINSESAEIEIDKKNYNLIFHNGERIILNKNEKSQTVFDKFVYSIVNKEVDILMMDKEHFNTIQLLFNTEKEFYYHGHNRIYQYLVILMILLLSQKIFFFYIPKKSIFKYYFILFFCLLILQIINSYLVFLLNNNHTNLYYYYSINSFFLISFFYLINNFNETI